VRVLMVRRVLWVLAGMLLTACGPGAGAVIGPRPAVKARPVMLRVQVRENNALVVREVALEDYVAATALSEVHPDVSDEGIAPRVFEVQAVLARTYAVTNRGRHASEGFDLCSTTHCQLYEPSRLGTSRWAGAAQAATAQTAGEVLWFAGAPARAVFHADCGGHTSAAGAVWGGPGPAYLVGERDNGPATSAHVEWTFETTATALRRALNADPRTAVGARLDRVEVAGRDPAGRAELVTLRGTRTFVVRGEIFREAVSRALGAKSIRSTLFNISKTKQEFTFTGKGYGHGVGLCQAGAIARLRAGASVNSVLAFYFPGTKVAGSWIPDP
jgi:stage II sporulation protein D